MVSNHVGRTLDGALPTAAVPPAALDGGIRRGGDVLKALALGARAVLVGRPVLWGLACGGEEGVRDVPRDLVVRTA